MIFSYFPISISNKSHSSILGLALFVFVSLFSFFSCQPKTENVDLLIKNATIYNGTLDQPFLGDVGIVADSIAFVIKGKANAIGAQEIDAAGYLLSPGFIDPHTHAARDLGDTEYNANLNYLFQGVTTVFVGNDGRSNTDISSQFALWEKQGIGTNAASYVGHASTRRTVMGMRDDEPTKEELDNMKSIVRTGMEAGAIGLSSGLYYAPASYAKTEEVIELARIAAEYGGVYDVHIRDESTYNIGLLEAIKETIRIAEEAGLPGHVAHIKCLGVDVWGRSSDVISIIEDARSRGVSITADQYPYEASGTSITGALIPRWVLSEDNPQEFVRLPSQKKRVETEIKENIRRRGGASTLLLISPNQKDSATLGLTLEQVAEDRGVSAVEAAIQLFVNGGSGLASFNMSGEDIEGFMSTPWVMTGSDGSHGHPRKYGSFSKKIKEYVVKKGTLSISEMIHRSTTLPASTFGLARRGYIAKGAIADLIIFKPEEISDRATFENHVLLSSGMQYVIVNGQIVISEGSYNGVLAGRALKHGS